MKWIFFWFTKLTDPFLSFLATFDKGPPDSVKQCKVSNETTNSLLIQCHIGPYNGLDQQMQLHVFDSRNEFLTNQSVVCRSADLLVPPAGPSAVSPAVILPSFGNGFESLDSSESGDIRTSIDTQPKPIDANCNPLQMLVWFSVRDLEAARRHHFMIFAQNARGRSEALRFSGQTMDLPAKHIGLGKNK